MKNILIILAFIPGVVFGQIDRSKRPEPQTAAVLNIKDSEVFKLSNGITVILSENHKLPRVSFDLVMNGTPQIEAKKAGVSDMFSSLFLNGTTNRTKDQLDGAIDFIGASLNASENSLSMSCLTKHMDKGLDLMVDVLKNVNFPETEFERIKKMMNSQLVNTKSDPDGMASNVEYKVNFPNHPFGDVMTETSLNAISRDDVIEYYKTYFTPDNCFLVIVGDITKEKATEIAKNYFENWQGQAAIKTEIGKGDFHKGNQVYFVKKQGAVQSAIRITFPLDIRTGDANQIPLTVTNNLLGGRGFGTRLMQNLREDKAYTYGCYSSMNITENGSWVSISGNFRNEVTDSAITEILYEIQRISEEPVDSEELELTKSTMNGSFSRSLESPQTIARFALNVIRYNLEKDYYKNYLKRLESVSVSNIQEMAKAYFTFQNANIVVVGSEDILDQLKKFDSDGNITILDAFGAPIEEMVPADISKEELINNYLLKTTASKSIKEANKKIKKIKSVNQISSLTNEQFPFPISMTELWVTPNKQARKVEAQGMVFEKFYFDGKSGKMSVQGMNKDLTQEEIDAYSKNAGLFPEMNYQKQNISTEILGIEKVNNLPCYVLKSVNDNSEKFDYYSVEGFLKIQTVEIETKDGETVESTTIYADHKDVGGIIFPHSKTISANGMTFNGTSSFEINGTQKIEDYITK
jgi:predicted Zn-dependent peptidase